MQVMKQLVIAALIAFSSAFFIGIGTMEKAEALCPKIGQYHNHGDRGVASRSGTCTSALNETGTKAAQGLVGWFKVVVYPIAGFGLAASVLMVVYAGYLYVTAGVDSKNVDKAKMLLISAAIGIFITLSTFIIAKMLSSLAGFM